jgi:protein-disulfide isomerase
MNHDPYGTASGRHPVGHVCCRMSQFLRNAWSSLIRWSGLTILLLGGACTEAPHSKAADVPNTDVRRLPPSRKDVLPDIMLQQADHGRVLGDPRVPVGVYVVSDYACATCRAWFDSTLPVIRAAYVDSGRVRLTWVHYPLREHPNAVRAASAALCAGVQGKFWEASARLFAGADRWSRAPAADANAIIDSLANAPGVDAFPFRDCTQSGRLLRQVRADIDWADTAKADVPPLVLVGSRRVSGAASLASLRAVIDSVLAGK